MLEIGKYNVLTVEDITPVGLSLTHPYGSDTHQTTVLLPSSELGQDSSDHPSIGDQLNVFVYYTQTGDLAASMLDVPMQVGDYCVLTVSGVSDAGAFFNWKLPRDLFCPKALQHRPLATGLSYVVRLIHDEEREKLVGSTKLHRFLIENGEDFAVGTEVDIMVFDSSDLGFKAIINGTHQGLLYHSDLFKKLKIGEQLKAYIKLIREDGKIDLCLQRHGKKAIKSLSEQIIEDLEAHGGISSLTDKSPSQEIQARFNVSKNAYKKALGTLYKNKVITIEKTHVSLVKK